MKLLGKDTKPTHCLSSLFSLAQAQVLFVQAGTNNPKEFRPNLFTTQFGKMGTHCGIIELLP